MGTPSAWWTARAVAGLDQAGRLALLLGQLASVKRVHVEHQVDSASFTGGSVVGNLKEGSEKGRTFFCWRRGGRDLTGRPVAAPPRLVRHRRRPAAVDPWPCTQPQAGADQGNEINRHDLLSCWLPYGKACEGVSLVVPGFAK